MGKINAVITGVGGYVPDYILNNEELSRMVDTTDEWITTRVGIKERRILTEEGLGTSYLARKAAKQLIQKTGVDPDTIDALIVTTTTPDYKFPSTASIVLGKQYENKRLNKAPFFMYGEVIKVLVGLQPKREYLKGALKIAVLSRGYKRKTSGYVPYLSERYNPHFEH